MSPIQPFDDDAFQRLQEHFHNPHHQGRCVNPTHSATVDNPMCGDWVRLEIRVSPDQIVAEAWFEAGGCVLSRAAASLLAEYVEGKQLHDIAAIRPELMLDLVAIRLSPRRMNCALLALCALRDSLRANFP